MASVVNEPDEGTGVKATLEPRAVAIQAVRGENLDGTMVPPSEGNEVRWDGR